MRDAYPGKFGKFREYPRDPISEPIRTRRVRPRRSRAKRLSAPIRPIVPGRHERGTAASCERARPRARARVRTRSRTDLIDTRHQRRDTSWPGSDRRRGPSSKAPANVRVAERIAPVRTLGAIVRARLTHIEARTHTATPFGNAPPPAAAAAAAAAVAADVFTLVFARSSRLCEVR